MINILNLTSFESQRLRKVSILSIQILIFCIFIQTCLVWSGSEVTYLLFAIVFNLLLFFAIKTRVSSGYLFLAVVSWIGYWLKLSLHLLYPSQWMEPTGYFNFSNDAVDLVVIVSSVGAMGILLAGVTARLLPSYKPKVKLVGSGSSQWFTALGLLGLMVAFNEIFNVVQALKPQPDLNLPFGLQGLVNWYLGGGWGLILMVPFCTNFCSGSDIRAVTLTTLAGVVISISLFSRGSLVFQALIIFISIFVYENLLPKVTLKRLLQYVMIIFFGVCVSLVVSMERRASVFQYSNQSSSLYYICRLPIERWIGLEGVMAVSAYPDKGFKLFAHAVSEKRLTGQVDFYTHKVALNPITNTKVHNYATPPGFIAFSYYSDRLWVVFIFTYILSIVLITSEKVVLSLSKNPFLASAIGLGFGIQMIHLGTGGLLAPAKIFLTSIFVAIFLGLSKEQIVTNIKKFLVKPKILKNNVNN